ncbi:hypothetical protein G6F65_021682 [Rhizopus arrhizus]|nr:hypothetical protein G6F65_021682 [Rhizopus arrhizus]
MAPRTSAARRTERRAPRHCGVGAPRARIDRRHAERGRPARACRQPSGSAPARQLACAALFILRYAASVVRRRAGGTPRRTPPRAARLHALRRAGAARRRRVWRKPACRRMERRAARGRTMRSALLHRHVGAGLPCR